ncbi:MAG TPA: FadR/GntR family transcriptional regulator [Steroidobacteraceae bacterium]
MTASTHGRNLTHGVANSLGAAIVTGVYCADNPIPNEADLCVQYRTSHSVVREAVKMLTAKGLLGSRPRRGTWVQPEADWNLLDPDVLGWLLERKYSPALLLEFTELRLAVEPVAAALAARAAGPKEKAAIRAAIERMHAAERGEDHPLDSDIAFHIAVLRASRNRFYAQFTGFVATALSFSIRTTNRYKGVELASVADHQRVADAILGGRPAVAEKAMRTLIEEAIELINRRDAVQARRLSANERR